MKKLVYILFASLILTSCASQKITPQNDRHIEEQEILSYFEFSNIIYSEIENIAERAKASDPEMGKYFRGQLKHFNREEYNKKLMTLINKNITNQEIDEIIVFIRSPQGKEARNVFTNITNPIAVEKHFASLSAESKSAVESFMQRTPGDKLGKLLGSMEFANINKGYGELLGCRYFSEHKPAKLKSLQTQGKCLNL